MDGLFLVKNFTKQMSTLQLETQNVAQRVVDLAIDLDSARLAVVLSHCVELWDFEKGVCEGFYNIKHQCSSAAWIQNGSVLVVATSGGNHYIRREEDYWFRASLKCDVPFRHVRQTNRGLILLSTDAVHVVRAPCLTKRKLEGDFTRLPLPCPSPVSSAYCDDHVFVSDG